MSRNLKDRAFVAIERTVIAVVALGWMCLNALVVQAFAETAMARAGWIGVEGTAIVSTCSPVVIDSEFGLGWAECAGRFVPADGSAGPPGRITVTLLSEKHAAGSRLDVRLVDQVAYTISWWGFTGGAAGALFFTLFGGAPLMMLAALLYMWLAGLDARMRTGLAVPLLATVAIVGEGGLAYLLERIVT